MKIIIRENILIIHYEPMNGNDWIKELFDKGQEVTLKQTFTFAASDMLSEDEYQLGQMINGYYCIPARILDTKFDVFIHPEISLDKKIFIKDGNISVFKKIDDLVNEEIIVGGDHAKAISKNDFLLLLKIFPTRSELIHYANSRITSILKNYLETTSEAEKKIRKIYGTQAQTHK